MHAYIYAQTHTHIYVCIYHNYIIHRYYMYIGVECFPPGHPVPLLNSSHNQSTVEGEMITFTCAFPYLKEISYFWIITLPNGSNIIIKNDKHLPNYQHLVHANYSYKI